jgi:hypothetical protein
VNVRWTARSSTTAIENITISNNGTWADAYQFGKPDDTTWNFDGCSFETDVQRNAYDQVPLLSCSTANGRIIVYDSIQRVLGFNVAPDAIQAALPPGIFVYDLVMITPANVRWPLMKGELRVVQGVTYPPA